MNWEYALRLAGNYLFTRIVSGTFGVNRQLKLIHEELKTLKEEVQVIQDNCRYCGHSLQRRL
jgi:hypothetical protein